MSGLLLSLFPGIDLLGRGFEMHGYCVVRGPDPLWGGDIRTFNPPHGKFEGVIGGPPCQKFSLANPDRDVEAGLLLVREFSRCVHAAAPEWFLLENTPGIPRIAIEGYAMQRFFLNAADCGGRQHRNRFFQFGSRDGGALICDRQITAGPIERTCLAGEGASPVHLKFGKRLERRTWAKFCALQGLPGDFSLPHMCVRERYRAVGNGVPVYMASVIARAILSRGDSKGVRICPCGCARRLTGRQLSSTPACRQRLRVMRREQPIAV